MTDYMQAPGSGLRKVIPETCVPPGQGDEERARFGTEAAASRAYIKEYKAAGSAEEKAALASKSREAENELRKKFAQDRDGAAVAEQYAGLLPVHLCDDIFQCRSLSKEEQEAPKVFPLKKRRTGRAVVPQREFQDNLEIFTEGMLRNLNWDNLFLAGGSVLASLLPIPEVGKSRQERRKYFHHEAYK